MTVTAQPEKDTRATDIKTVNTERTFAPVTTKSAWEKRSENIREQVLISAGLWPMPERPPLRSQISGKISGDGYSIEKVWIETRPGFYLGGNLYRPVGKGSGPFPAVLNPHGHWDYGRFADYKEGSVAARCIGFARQGMVALSYDMVGYNDTFFPDHTLDKSVREAFYQRHRAYATNGTDLLWNINLLGLQTWDSIRALDFLESLPDVDKKRLACTGESGGGTQTYLLGAVDDRLAAQIPVVMVSHTMQGGCSCENAPGLRIDFSNVDIAASAAPRPQMLIGASGDWTKSTGKMEGPALASVYRLFGAENHLAYQVFEFRHNYNQTSREAAYAFLAPILHPAAPMTKETPYVKEPDSALRVFPDDKLPANALTEAAFQQSLIQMYQAQLAALQPRDEKSFREFRKVLRPAWQHTLQVESPRNRLWSQSVYTRTLPDGTLAERLYLGRNEGKDRLPVLIFTPGEKFHGKMVVLAHPDGMEPFLDKNNQPTGLAKELLRHKIGVVLCDTFLTGENANYEISSARYLVDLFFVTYNRTDLQERVQDLLTVAAHVRKQSKVYLCGVGRAGLWTLLAAPGEDVDGVVADASRLDVSSDQELLARDLFIPGLRKLGAWETAASLAAPNPVLVFNASDKFSTGQIKATYATTKNPSAIRTEKEKITDAELAQWLNEQK